MSVTSIPGQPFLSALTKPVENWWRETLRQAWGQLSGWIFLCKKVWRCIIFIFKETLPMMSGRWKDRQLMSCRHSMWPVSVRNRHWGHEEGKKMWKNLHSLRDKGTKAAERMQGGASVSQRWHDEDEGNEKHMTQGWTVFLCAWMSPRPHICTLLMVFYHLVQLWLTHGGRFYCWEEGIGSLNFVLTPNLLKQIYS